MIYLVAGQQHFFIPSDHICFFSDIKNKITPKMKVGKGSIGSLEREYVEPSPQGEMESKLCKKVAKQLEGPTCACPSGF